MPKRRWTRGRKLALAAGIVVVLGVALSLAVDPLVTWRTRKALAEMDGYRGHFSHLDVTLRDLSYRIYDLEVEKVGAGCRSSRSPRPSSASTGRSSCAATSWRRCASRVRA